MIVSKACTMNILLALTLALASVISYDHKFCFHLVLMFIYFEKCSSVLNLDNKFFLYLYYKKLTIITDDHKWGLHYNYFISPRLSLS